MPNEHKIAELNKLYLKAEMLLKKYEIVSAEGLVVPVINELRYAGKHLLKSLMAPDAGQSDAEIEKAINHARRGIYDIYDALILFYLERIATFQKLYKRIPLTPVIHNYSQALSRLKEIQDSLEEPREPLGGAKGEENLNALIAIWHDCEAAIPELNKLAVRMRRSTLRQWIVLAATAAGGLWAMVALYDRFMAV